MKREVKSGLGGRVAGEKLGGSEVNWGRLYGNTGMDEFTIMRAELDAMSE